MNLKKFLFEGEILRLMSFTVLIKPIGLFTQVLTAKYFGAGVEVDAYVFSLFLVTFLGMTFGNIFTTVAIPQITKIRQSLAPEQVEAYKNSIFLLFWIPVVGLLVAFYVKGDLVVDLIGAQLPVETRQMACRVIKLLSLPAILLGGVKILSGLLNLHKRFRVPALMLPLHATFMLVALLLFHRQLGIFALVAGWIGSYLVQAAITFFWSVRTRALVLCRPGLPRGEIAVLWQLSGALLVARLLLVVNTFVDKWFAAGLPVGSISYINYSMTIISFGEQLFSMSLIVVMFTKMSESLAEGDIAGCDGYILQNLKKVSNLVVPGCVGLAVVCPEVIRILFQRGAFDPQDALQTSRTLQMYMLGLPAVVMNLMIARLFHSLQKIKERIWLALQFILCNILGNMLLVKTLGTVGLAVSSSVAINLHVLLSLFVLHRFKQGFSCGGYLGIITRTYAMGALAYFAYQISGMNGQLAGLISTGGLAPVFLSAAAKFLLVVSIFGLQLFAWKWFRSRTWGAAD